MDDYNIRTLRDSIADLLNEARLPIEVKRYVVKEIYDTVSQAAEAEILRQGAEIRNKAKESKVAE